jgi:hypothetical protein
MDGHVVDGVVGHEQRWYSRTRDGRFKEHVYRLGFVGDGEKWIPILDYARTEVFDAETCERIA